MIIFPDKIIEIAELAVPKPNRDFVDGEIGAGEKIICLRNLDIIKIMRNDFPVCSLIKADR